MTTFSVSAEIISQQTDAFLGVSIGNQKVIIRLSQGAYRNSLIRLSVTSR